MKEIIFIRHCESEANAGLATHLPQTIGLTHKGFDQSRYIPDCFDKSPELIITSPFLRTKQTAQTTIDKFSQARVEEWNVQEFTYLSLVKYADTTMEFRRPFVEEYWKRCEAFYCDGDGTESFADFMSRVEALLDQVSKAEEKTIAVFTHGQFMKAILWLLINNFPGITDSTMNAFYEFLGAVFVFNGSIFKVYIDAGDFRFSGISAAHLPWELLSF